VECNVQIAHGVCFPHVEEEAMPCHATRRSDLVRVVRGPCNNIVIISPYGMEEVHIYLMYRYLYCWRRRKRCCA